MRRRPGLGAITRRLVGVAAALLISFAAAAADPTNRKGIGDNGPVKLTDQSPAELARTIADFNSLGVKWLRLDFDWSVIEPRRGEYHLSDCDRVVKALAAAGINVLGVIDYTPAWANGAKPEKFYPPDEASEYGRFAGSLAGRYAPLGLHAWEIWNEENVAQFWRPAPDPQRYIGLLKSAYRAIHESDEQAIVITGGLAQPRNTPTSIAAIDFLRALYAAGGQPYFDAVADHPYSSPYMPSAKSSSNNWQRLATTSPSLRGVMSSYGDARKQLWITEYGAPTGGVNAYSQAIVIGEDQQAQMVREAYALVGTYAWAGPLFWYEYQDLCPPAAAASSECYYGLIRYDGSRKQSYGEYRSAPQ